MALRSPHGARLLTFADDLVRPPFVWLADHLGRALQLIALLAADVTPGSQGCFVVSSLRGPAVHISILHLDGGAPRDVYREQKQRKRRNRKWHLQKTCLFQSQSPWLAAFQMLDLQIVPRVLQGVSGWGGYDNGTRCQIYLSMGPGSSIGGYVILDKLLNLSESVLLPMS